MLSVGYDIVLAILHPFLSPAHKDLYNWLFVLGISASAVWLVTALYRHSEGLVEHFKKARPPAPGKKLRVLRRPPCDEHARFCAGCGKAAPA